MPEVDTRSMTVNQLVESSGDTEIGIQSGMKAQKVQAEMNRRLIEALNFSKESTKKFSKRLECLTWILIVLTVIFVLITCLPLFRL